MLAARLGRGAPALPCLPLKWRPQLGSWHTRQPLALCPAVVLMKHFPILPPCSALTGCSKLANILFTRELAKRLGTAATANSLHPGGAWTAIGLLQEDSSHVGLLSAQMGLQAQQGLVLRSEPLCLPHFARQVW